MTATAYKVGDPVYVQFDNCGGPAIVVEVRDTAMARHRVLLDDASQPAFWAHDFEVMPADDPPPPREYDSRLDTMAHIDQVRANLDRIRCDLEQRGRWHDLSKLREPERSAFDEATPKLRGLTYGSEEYRAALADLKPALDHHYAANSHHPEHYPDGVAGMTLMDLVEMFADWKAATMRHADGNLARSIEINRERYSLDPQVVAILENTRKALDW